MQGVILANVGVGADSSRVFYPRTSTEHPTTRPNQPLTLQDDSGRRLQFRGSPSISPFLTFLRFYLHPWPSVSPSYPVKVNLLNSSQRRPHPPPATFCLPRFCFDLTTEIRCRKKHECRNQDKDSMNAEAAELRKVVSNLEREKEEVIAEKEVLYCRNCILCVRLNGSID